MLVIWQVRVSNAAVYFQIVVTTCDAVKKPVTHILVKNDYATPSIYVLLYVGGSKGKAGIQI